MLSILKMRRSMKKSENTISGLLVRGSIVARTKKEIQAKNESVEVVTYTIATESTRRLYVEDYSPDSYFEIGENVELPVYVKPYQKKNGMLSYTFNIQKEYKSSEF